MVLVLANLLLLIKTPALAGVFFVLVTGSVAVTVMVTALFLILVTVTVKVTDMVTVTVRVGEDLLVS